MAKRTPKSKTAQANAARKQERIERELILQATKCMGHFGFTKVGPYINDVLRRGLARDQEEVRKKVLKELGDS